MGRTVQLGLLREREGWGDEGLFAACVYNGAGVCVCVLSFGAQGEKRLRSGMRGTHSCRVQLTDGECQGMQCRELHRCCACDAC
jgi:hypothetical protein